MTTKCPKCGYQRSDRDDPKIPNTQCPFCGIYYFKYLDRKINIATQKSSNKAKIAQTTTTTTPGRSKKTKLSTYILGGIFTAFAVTYASLKIERRNINPPLQPHAEQVIASHSAAPQPIWTYQTIEDPMGRGSKYLAYTESLNTTQFEFPYQGLQKATLVIRKEPGQAFKILLVLKTAHFLCHADCTVLTRFDDGIPIQYPASIPDDRSTSVIFILGGLPFIEDIKQSKKLTIEALFFKSGLRIFEFNIDELKFDTSYHPEK